MQVEENSKPVLHSWERRLPGGFVLNSTRVKADPKPPGWRRSQVSLRVALLIVALLPALTSCSQFNRPYFLRFWEYNRLASRQERAQGHLNTAEKFAKAALGYAEYLGRDDFRLAVSLNDLAQIFLRKEKYKAAEPLLKQALEVLDRSAQKDEKSVLVGEVILQERAQVLQSLGDVFFQKSEFAKALDCFSEARKILSRWCQEKTLDQGNPYGLDYVKTCWGEAEAELKLKRPEEAKRSFRLALSLAEASNYSIAEEIKSDYASLLEEQGDKAELLQVNAAKRWNDLSKKAHEYYLAKNYADAKRRYEDALAEALRMPAADMRIALSYKCLSDCAKKIGDANAVIENDQKALQRLAALKYPPISLLDNIYGELAGYFELIGNLDQQYATLKEQLKLRQEHYTSRRTETLAALAALTLRMNKQELASNFAEQGYQSSQSDPASNRAAAQACFTLSEVFFSLKDYGKAESAIRRSVKITRDVLRLNDTRNPVALYQLANILAMEHKSTESSKAASEALALAKKLPSKKFLATAMVLSDLMRRHLSDPDSSSARRFASWGLELANAFALQEAPDKTHVMKMTELKANIEKSIKEQLK